LDEQKARRNFENEAVAATQQERLMCLNTGGYSIDDSMRRFVLKSEEKMLLSGLERVRTKLAKLV
jgi:rRNA-processing protein FCF1